MLIIKIIYNVHILTFYVNYTETEPAKPNLYVRRSLPTFVHDIDYELNKKAQLSLTNPRDAKACQKLLQFDVITTLSLTILAYLHSFSCCCVRNLRNPAKFTENSSL